MKKTLHPLPSTIEPHTQADYALQHLCNLCGLHHDLIQAETFELSPDIQQKLETDFFAGSIPANLLADPDWRIHLQTLPGWEILLLNDHVLQVTGGMDGDHTPPPFDLSQHLIHLHPKADLNRLSEWSSLRQLSVPHLMNDLSFLQQLPLLETLTLENISWVDDFTPLASLTHLKTIGLGNGGYHDHAAGQAVLTQIRAQAPNLPEFNLDHWQD
jgi:hypothetical protein